ncbi:hypothetical protein HA466_0214790 [Hirschfeldia incana]|nr:hypothetical protein HA466_0214790 [Hirschfeldia incana]
MSTTHMFNLNSEEKHVSLDPLVFPSSVTTDGEPPASSPDSSLTPFPAELLQWRVSNKQRQDLIESFKPSITGIKPEPPSSSSSLYRRKESLDQFEITSDKRQADNSKARIRNLTLYEEDKPKPATHG